MVNGPGNLPDIIKHTVVNQAPKITLKPEQKFPTQSNPAIAPGPQADQVTISPQAKELQALTPHIQAVPEVRPNQVEQVRQRLTNVSNDTAVNARIAEKLLTGN